jgi:hypothetical protein
MIACPVKRDPIYWDISRGIGYFATLSVIGFKQHYVPFNGFTSFSIQAPSAFKDYRHRHLNAAQQHLNTERSEVLEHHEVVLEPHEMGIERRQALEYRTAAIEHRTK